ncbi:hypothetical protein A3J41_03240 [candidate division TM6 bacterium RIFCSPHIGHO2_12_FULL_38_8]|nr:MAG: hypothetical protein A3J41_03240 [candidate division TM6 bacterium RIFCSPHIGHO2_12_FULL_38_8]
MHWQLYRILIEKQAQKFLKSLSNPKYLTVFSKIQMLNTAQSSQLDIKKLQGYAGHYRLRVGDYRIVFVVLSDQRILIVTLAEHRKIIYQLLQRKK